MKMVKCIVEFEYFYCILENRNFISKIRISKVTDYAALRPMEFPLKLHTIKSGCSIVYTGYNFYKILYFFL